MQLASLSLNSLAPPPPENTARRCPHEPDTRRPALRPGCRQLRFSPRRPRAAGPAACCVHRPADSGPVCFTGGRSMDTPGSLPWGDRECGVAGDTGSCSLPLLAGGSHECPSGLPLLWEAPRMPVQSAGWGCTPPVCLPAPSWLTSGGNPFL